MLVSAAIAADNPAKVPHNPSAADILGSERPKDWAYEESILLAAGADKTYNTTNVVLPAPQVAHAPRMDGKLDDPVWSQATAWPIWVPWQRAFDKISWNDDLPLVPMALLACRNGNDIYLAVRWSPDAQGPVQNVIDQPPGGFTFGPPIGFELENWMKRFSQPIQSAAYGVAVVQWHFKDVQSVEFALRDLARGGGGIAMSVRIVAADLAIRV